MDTKDVVEVLLDEEEKIWGGWAVACTIVLVLAFYGFCRYLRFIFPCLTPFEMDQVLKKIEDLYVKLVEDGPSVATEWTDIVTTLRRLEMEASRIRVQAIKEYLWKTYCGFNPLLVPKIARWYKSSKELERRMIIVGERDKQSHLEAEGQIATGSSSQAQASTSSYESRFGSQHEYPPNNSSSG
ncbi:hypothetical protein L218DRAFT_1005120 [Marasmius fiardii PR-910]|nr:hypothetical protein L218DRAFT_1005120 [Marasmius fiardii PR-910]